MVCKDNKIVEWSVVWIRKSPIGSSWFADKKIGSRLTSTDKKIHDGR